MRPPPPPYSQTSSLILLRRLYGSNSRSHCQGSEGSGAADIFRHCVFYIQFPCPRPVRVVRDLHVLLKKQWVRRAAKTRRSFYIQPHYTLLSLNTLLLAIQWPLCVDIFFLITIALAAWSLTASWSRPIGSWKGCSLSLQKVLPPCRHIILWALDKQRSGWFRSATFTLLTAWCWVVSSSLERIALPTRLRSLPLLKQRSRRSSSASRITGHSHFLGKSFARGGVSLCWTTAVFLYRVAGSHFVSVNSRLPLVAVQVVNIADTRAFLLLSRALKWYRPDFRWCCDASPDVFVFVVGSSPSSAELTHTQYDVHHHSCAGRLRHDLELHRAEFQATPSWGK